MVLDIWLFVLDFFGLVVVICVLVKCLIENLGVIIDVIGKVDISGLIIDV